MHRVDAERVTRLVAEARSRDHTRLAHTLALASEGELNEALARLVQHYPSETGALHALLDKSTAKDPPPRATRIERARYVKDGLRQLEADRPPYESIDEYLDNEGYTPPNFELKVLRSFRALPPTDEEFEAMIENEPLPYAEKYLIEELLPSIGLRADVLAAFKQRLENVRRREQAARERFDSSVFGRISRFDLPTLFALLTAGGVIDASFLAITPELAEAIRAARAQPGFYRALTLSCFPRTTRLAFDAEYLLRRGYIVGEDDAWRRHFIRLIRLFKRVGLALSNTRVRTPKLTVVVNDGNALEYGSERSFIRRTVESEPVDRVQTCDDVTEPLNIKATIVYRDANPPGATSFVAPTLAGDRPLQITPKLASVASWRERALDESGATREYEFAMRPRDIDDAQQDEIVRQTLALIAVDDLPTAQPDAHVTITFRSLANVAVEPRTVPRWALIGLVAFLIMRDTNHGKVIFRWQYGTDSSSVELATTFSIYDLPPGEGVGAMTFAQLLPPDVSDVRAFLMLF